MKILSTLGAIHILRTHLGGRGALSKSGQERAKGGGRGSVRTRFMLFLLIHEFH